MIVHGITYETLPHVAARIAELTVENMIHGESDGRVTELREILAALYVELGGVDADVAMLLQIGRELAQHHGPTLPLEQEFQFVRAYRARLNLEAARDADAVAQMAVQLSRHEHDYIPTAETVNDAYGPLLCKVCGLSDGDAVYSQAQLLAARAASGVAL